MSTIDFGVKRVPLADRLAAEKAAASKDAVASSSAKETVEADKQVGLNTPVDNIKEPTTDANGTNDAAVNTTKAYSDSALCYFRAPFPVSVLITDKGKRIKFGDPIPYWHITEDPEEIMFLRNEFVIKDGSQHVGIEESDIHSYNAMTTIMPEILPLPGQTEVDLS